jgi:amino acid transporter
VLRYGLDHGWHGIVAADLAVSGADAQKYFTAALTAAITLVVLAYLLIYPAFLVLRIRRPELERPFRVPGGTATASVITGLSTGWALLAVVCLLWPGLGTDDPDAALPAGFAGERLQFELLVLAPPILAVLAASGYVLATRRRPTPRLRQSRTTGR